jgi:hypothetical protein
LTDVEKSALRALEIDKNNSEPRVHFVLAQIYEAKGDRADEAAQLREYLKSRRRCHGETISLTAGATKRQIDSGRI